ncbi:centromere protein C-like [Lytechinus variegatus]|uniref:centromere protein C-like n=1 Tax=Lytechinus variegatus TaxID=7654 RepID=UPI001BB209A5|nr:centromere protein C-like [Lytechinus variegatus]
MTTLMAKNVFVNPFYQEGVGRRTGVVLKKDVRKDSDGFEVFDDYWSESENDATINNTTFAADKENNGDSKHTNRRKKSSLKSMPSFSPQAVSTDREESKVEFPQDVSHATGNASTIEADITGSIIKHPVPPSLEPLSVLKKFKTKQRLSFSEFTSSEDSQTTEEEVSVEDESQEDGTSSEGTIKAASSQSEVSQDEENDEERPINNSEQESSQTTTEQSSQDDEEPETKGAGSYQIEEVLSSNEEDTMQTRGRARHSRRGKSDVASSQEEPTCNREVNRQSTTGKTSDESSQEESSREGNRQSTRGKSAEESTQEETRKGNRRSTRGKSYDESSQEGPTREVKRRSTRGKSSEESSQEGPTREVKRRSTRGKSSEESSQEEPTREVKRRSTRGKSSEESSQEEPTREVKRRSTRGKFSEKSSQEEPTRKGKRHSERGKCDVTSLQEELVGEQKAEQMGEKVRRKSTQQASQLESNKEGGEVVSEEVRDEMVGEPEVKKEEEKGRRKSSRQSRKVINDNEGGKVVDKGTDKDAEIGPKKHSQSNTSGRNKIELKDSDNIAKKDDDTKKRRSTRQSKSNESKVGENIAGDADIDTNMKSDTRPSRNVTASNVNTNKVNDSETVLEKEQEKEGVMKHRKSTGQSAMTDKELEKEEGVKGNEDDKTTHRNNFLQSGSLERTGEDSDNEVMAEETRCRSNRKSKGEDMKTNLENILEDIKEKRRSGKLSNSPAKRPIEEKKEVTENEGAPEMDGGIVERTIAEQIKEGPESQEASETETERKNIPDTEEGVKKIEIQTKQDSKTTVGANTEDRNVSKQTGKLTDTSDVDEDEDTEKVFFSLRASFAVPSVHELEEEFDVADDDTQEFGLMDNTQKGNCKETVKITKNATKKGNGTQRESKEEREPEKLEKSRRKSKQNNKEESKHEKVHKKRARKRGTEIQRADDNKKLKDSLKEISDDDVQDSKLAMKDSKNRGNKSTKEKNPSRRRQKSSESTSQTSSSDVDVDSQVDDEGTSPVDLPPKKQRKQKKINSDKLSEASNSMKPSDEAQEKAGSKASRSRRSSVHFTTKDMISVSGDISIHQVSSSEDKSSDDNSSKSGSTKVQEDSFVSTIQHQTESESTAESDRESIRERPSRRGRKSGTKSKKLTKRSQPSSAVASTSYVADAEKPSSIKKRRMTGNQKKRGKSLQSMTDARETIADGYLAHATLDNPSDNQSLNQSSRIENRDTSPISSSGTRSAASSGSILKGSKNNRQRGKQKKKYSILFTEKPLSKAYIIKPDEGDGVRRTKRQRVRPLEYWRNERPLYERRKSGGLALAGIISPEAPDRMSSRSVRSLKKQAKPKGHLPVTPAHISIHASPPVGTSDVCLPTVNVVNPETNQEVAIDAVATSKMLKFTGPSGLPAKPDDAITITKALSQKAFAAGVLTVRPFGEKGSQLVRRDTMVFYVVRGKIAMTLHKTSQILQNGDWFFVPKGNVYNIKNLRKDEAKLTFFQLKSA